jgi:peptidoglycan/LPS O-acetylase OafA/YrhL
VGVDVFFVISGFLITSIILRETKSASFRLRNFWMRRIRRLFPALAVVLLATSAVSSLILYQGEWNGLGAQLRAVLLLIANFHLRSETGDYWGPSAEDVPLLHTWSLAVEEQFYLFFPLLVLLLLRFAQRSIVPLLSCGALLSLIHCLVTTSSDPSYAFYLLPTRAWELLAGCLLAFWTQNESRSPSPLRWTSLLSFLGLFAILASCFFIKREVGFPGFQALIPVLGTVLLIASTNHNRSLLRSALSAGPLVFIGRISYSLYLWHWPVIVLWRLQTMEPVSALRHAIPILLLTFAAATLSYFFVEKPFRRDAFSLRSAKFATIAATFLLLLGLAHLVRNNQLPSRAEPSFEAPTFSSHRFGAHQNEAWKTGGVLVGEAPPEVVVIGSSHALMYASTIAELAHLDRRSVAFLCLGNAFGRFHTPGDDAIFRDGIAEFRADFDRARLAHLAKWRPKQVLWFGRWDNQYEILGADDFDSRIRRSIALLLEHTAQVSLFSQTPFSMERRSSIVRFASTLQRQERPVVGREAPDRHTLRKLAHQALQRMAHDDPMVTLTPLHQPFELPDGSVRILSEKNELLYHDYDHLSDAGAALLREQIQHRLSTP